MLDKLRQHIVVDLQRFMERLNGCGVERGLGLVEKKAGFPHSAHWAADAGWIVRRDAAGNG